jgi:hypothetical protein
VLTGQEERGMEAYQGRRKERGAEKRRYRKKKKEHENKVK